MTGTVLAGQRAHAFSGTAGRKGVRHRKGDRHRGVTGTVLGCQAPFFRFLAPFFRFFLFFVKQNCESAPIYTDALMRQEGSCGKRENL